jgi:hypothetical protein
MQYICHVVVLQASSNCPLSEEAVDNPSWRLVPCTLFFSNKGKTTQIHMYYAITWEMTILIVILVHRDWHICPLYTPDRLKNSRSNVHKNNDTVTSQMTSTNSKQGRDVQTSLCAATVVDHWRTFQEEDFVRMFKTNNQCTPSQRFHGSKHTCLALVRRGTAKVTVCFYRFDQSSDQPSWDSRHNRM